MPHATYNPECRKTGSDGSHVCTHGDAAVDIDTEVTDDGHRNNSYVLNNDMGTEALRPYAHNIHHSFGQHKISN